MQKVLARVRAAYARHSKASPFEGIRSLLLPCCSIVWRAVLAVVMAVYRLFHSSCGDSDSCVSVMSLHE